MVPNALIAPTSTRTLFRVLALGLAISIIASSLASCNKARDPNSTGVGNSATTGIAYVDAYNRGSYAAAKTQALTAYSGATGAKREQAALIAGLSAQALEQNVEAKRYLRPLLPSQDSEIAGRAGAGLGLIARDEGDKSSAAKLLADAALKLKGDDSAKAAMFAGDAFTSLAKPADASAQYSLAARAATSSTLKAQIQDRRAGKKFAVQAGAFATRANADKRLREVAPKSTAFGYGSPRIVSGTSAGKPVFFVYIGEFGLRQDATEAMMKMKVPEGRVAETN